MYSGTMAWTEKFFRERADVGGAKVRQRKTWRRRADDVEVCLENGKCCGWRVFTPPVDSTTLTVD